MGALTLEEIKSYLRVDSDEDDALIIMFENFSREEIKNSTGMEYNPDNISYSYKMAQLMIITDRYENRGSEDGEFKANNALSCLYTKLKTQCYKGDSDEN